MKKLLIIILLLQSCSLQRKLDKYCPLCVQESKTETVIEYRDTTIEIPGETITLIDSLYCDSLGNVISKLDNTIRDKDGRILNLQTRLKNNVYTTKATVDTVYKVVKGNTIYKKEIIYKKGKDIRIKYIPGFVQFLSWLGGIFLIIILLYILFKFLRKPVTL